jgi:hypothetical protein
VIAHPGADHIRIREAKLAYAVGESLHTRPGPVPTAGGLPPRRSDEVAKV